MIRKKSIKNRLVKRMTFVFLTLFSLIMVILIWSFREIAITEATRKAMTVAELVRDSITTLMVHDTIHKRALYLDNIKETQGLRSLKIIRGKPVIEQFGPATKQESPENQFEEQLMNTGEIQTEFIEAFSNVEYSLVIPMKAYSHGSINCLKCHHVEEGTTLGGVSLAMDLSSQRTYSMASAGLVGLVTLLTFAITIFILYIFFIPYRDIFYKLKNALAKVQEGYLGDRVETDLEDEAAEVVHSVNQMTEKLSELLEQIRKKVASITGFHAEPSGNVLKDTVRMIDELVEIYNFKRTIEKDKTKKEVFIRMENVIKNKGIDRFSIYEVNDTQSACVISDGGSAFPKAPGWQWCNQTINNDSHTCRAVHTGGPVDSAKFPDVCSNFIGKSVEGELLDYYCIPSYINGQVGNVLQLVYPHTERKEMFDLLPGIKGCLEESIPVIEVKTLNEKLKEQSIIDRLTGIYNRHFLDDFSSKLKAHVERTGSTIGILMVDIDFFKEVNDIYGHDVGDYVLQEVVRIITDTIRKTDYCIRFGGEEFLALLMDIKKDEAVLIAEKIRENIEQLEIEHGGISIKRSASIGVAEYPNHSDKFWRCVKYSDIALYNAKNAGRNRTISFDRQMWSTAAGNS